MLLEFWVVGFVVSCCSDFGELFYDCCFINLGGQFFNKTSLVEKLELFCCFWIDF